MSLIRQLALRKIQTIGDHLDQLGAHSKISSFDIDFQEDGLLITDSLKRQFLLNYHGVTNQIWYSSAISGAHHFALKNGEWRCTRTEEALNELLSAELSLICQQSVCIIDSTPDLDHVEDLPEKALTNGSKR